ncbi:MULTISPECIES: virulence factor [Sneathiella]|jgi:hypothetical protein|uniref:virulence factor n=1 Tax=Sneathiella TaxID=510690 RepID=UPI00146B7BF7|nr:virulence factor [Sneathiella aquimaris]
MQINIIYWRDIPSQVSVQKGRRSAKLLLEQRFQEAIDQAAMRSGAHESDAYLQDWRRVLLGNYDGDLQTLADAKAAELEASIGETELSALVKNNGWKEA